VDEDVRRILEGPNVAHIATVLPDGAPHSVPIWILFEDERIVFFTQKGTRKEKNIEHDPRVAVSVLDSKNPYRQAWLRGRVVDRREDEGIWDAIDRMSEKYIGEAFPWRSPDSVLYTVEIERSGFYGLPFDPPDSPSQ
jgi:PPOX class probable F420-dependent enzyme